MIMERDVDRLANLYKTANGAKRALVLIYGNPDPDALASAWALREILKARNVPLEIEYTGEIGRLENESMIKNLHIPVTKMDQESVRKADLIALVDAQPSFFRDFTLPRCDIVVDHHPFRLTEPVAHTDIRTHCLATASMLTEYVRKANVRVSRTLATALYYAIDVDSRHRNSAPSNTDREALDFLIGRVSWHLLRRIEFSSYSLARLDYFSIALVGLRYARNVLYSNIGSVPSSDVCVQIADFLMRVKEANWALVCGAVGRKLVIVFRCDGQKKHAGRSAEAAFSQLGSAGGHATMGRAEIDESSLPDGILLTQNEKVDVFILGSLAKVTSGFRPLLELVKRRGGGNG